MMAGGCGVKHGIASDRRVDASDERLGDAVGTATERVNPPLGKR
jgi:hypothetical protein